MLCPYLSSDTKETTSARYFHTHIIPGVLLAARSTEGLRAPIKPSTVPQMIDSYVSKPFISLTQFNLQNVHLHSSKSDYALCYRFCHMLFFHVCCYDASPEKFLQTGVAESVSTCGNLDGFPHRLATQRALEAPFGFLQELVVKPRHCCVFINKRL